MTTNAKTDPGEVHELAGGWISERKGTPVPVFLKIAYLGFSAFGIVYLLLYATGEVGHGTRGPLVQQINAAMDTPGAAWIAVLVAILVAFGAVLAWYTMVRRSGEAE